MMGASEQRYTLDRGIQVASILVVAFSASVIVFGVVGTFLAEGDRGPVPAVIPLAAISAAFFALIGSVAYRRLSFQPLRLQRLFEDAGEAGLASHLVRTTIVSSALAEAVSLFGLVLAVMTGDKYYLYALAVIALLGVLSNFPRAGRWRSLRAEAGMRTAAGTTSGNFGGSSA
jgi:hypothetical protein